MPADPLEIAIRAEEAARSAHQRLDRMNGSIDRLATEVSKTNATAVEILRRLDRTEAMDEGEQVVSRRVVESKRLLVGTTIAVLSSSVAALLVTFAVQGHL